MDGVKLQDRISRGMGVAARRLGTPYTVYRPVAANAPLSSRNGIITLYAAFNAGDDGFRRPQGYGQAVWWGIYDAAYTQAGDYLSGAAGIFFVASQLPLLPVECIKTNRVLMVARSSPVVAGGYSGLVATGSETVLAGWPASVLSLNTRISGSLPETRFGNWSVLLPALPVAPQIADIVTDDTGRIFVVGAAEQSDLGWRLVVREVAG
jgi:hypothetical protein